MKIIIFISSIFALHLCIGQTDLINTNIDPSFIKPKWMNDYLKTTVFRNSDSIKIAYNTTVWYSLNNNNRPAVYINNNNHYLYNQKAILNINHLCPYGFRVPNFNDLKNSKIEILTKMNTIETKGSSKINNVYLSPIIMQNEGEFSLSSTGSELYLATNKDPKIIDDKYKAAILNLKTKGIEEWDITGDYGISVKCVENFNETLKDEEFEYELVLPKEYNYLIYKLSNILINSNCADFKFSGRLRFDSNGSNISDGFSVLDKNSNSSLYNSIKNTITGWNVYPYYNDINVRSLAEINLKFQKIKDSQSKFILLQESEIRKKDIKNINVNSSDFKKAVEKEFLFNYNTINNRIELNGTLQQESVVNVFNKVKGKGPVYSLLSIVPGLGQLKINQQDGFRKLRMWHFSVPIGAIAIASKIYSNLYYSKYLKNIDASDSRKNYIHANISQKVFLSSLGVYSVMSLVDFSITFTIGCKNKMLQYKINTQKI